MVVWGFLVVIGGTLRRILVETYYRGWEINLCMDDLCWCIVRKSACISNTFQNRDFHERSRSIAIVDSLAISLKNWSLGFFQFSNFLFHLVSFLGYYWSSSWRNLWFLKLRFALIDDPLYYRWCEADGMLTVFASCFCGF